MQIATPRMPMRTFITRSCLESGEGARVRGREGASKAPSTCGSPLLPAAPLPLPAAPLPLPAAPLLFPCRPSGMSGALEAACGPRASSVCIRTG